MKRIKRMTDKELKSLFRVPEGIHPCKILKVDVVSVSKDVSQLTLKLEVTVGEDEYLLEESLTWSMRQQALCAVFTVTSELTPDNLVGRRLLVKIVHRQKAGVPEALVQQFLPVPFKHLKHRRATTASRPDVCH